MNNFLNVYFNLIQQIISFGYNVRNEVVSATLGTNEYTYSYDPIGNRTASTQNADSKLYISNPLNQYIAGGIPLLLIGLNHAQEKQSSLNSMAKQHL